MYLLLGAIVWVLIAFWPARVASRKGYSFFLFFFLSIIFFFLSLLLAYALKDRTKSGNEISSAAEIE